MVFITCFAHGLHRICGTIRSNFKTIDRLIATGKKVFLKAPARINYLRRKFPNLPLPPKPITTRWGTWLEAVSYYSDNFNEFKTVVMGLKDDAECVSEAKALVQKNKLIADLAFIKSNLCFIAQNITKLQDPKLSLDQSFRILDATIEKIESCTGPIAAKIIEKTNYVFSKHFFDADKSARRICARKIAAR